MPFTVSALQRSDSSIHYEGTVVGCGSYCELLRRVAVSHCLSPGRARAFDPIKPIIRTQPLRSCGETASNLRGELGALHTNEAKYSNSQGGWVPPTPPPQHPSPHPHPDLRHPSRPFALLANRQRVPHQQEVSSHRTGTPEVRGEIRFTLNCKASSLS